MKQSTSKAQFFDQMAALWQDAKFTPAEQKKLKVILREAGVRRGMVIFEPGCGAGRLTRILARRVGPSGKVIALDISPKLIAACRKNVSSSNVIIQRGCVESARLSARSVDLVLCLNAFPHFDDKLAALRVFRRVLKNEGKVIVAHLCGRQHLNALHRASGKPIMHDLLPAPRILRRLFRYAGFHVESLVDRKDLFLLVARCCESRIFS